MADSVSLEPTIDYAALEAALMSTSDKPSLYYAIVNAPFNYPVFAASLFLGIIVLLLVDKATGTIHRIAITDNMHAERAKRRSAKKFEDIKIPLHHEENIISKAIKTGGPEFTVDWQYLFTPDLTPEQARFNQADSGIGFSAVYPIKSDGHGSKAIGALIFSYYQFPEKVGRQQRSFMRKYTDIVSRTMSIKHAV